MENTLEMDQTSFKILAAKKINRFVLSDNILQRGRATFDIGRLSS
jgi:hypothetical protein